MIEKKLLLEFSECKNINKFSFNYPVYFISTNHKMSNWFNNNKDQILESDDPLCKEVVRQYLLFRDKIKEMRKKTLNISFSEKSKVCKEFFECNDLNKFDPSYDIRFSNGINMGEWFLKNIESILNSKSTYCVKISEQYRKKQLLDMKAKRLLNHKKKLYFFKEPDLNKFDINCDFIFFDGSRMSSWFYQNKDEILSSDDEIFKIITKQYELFLSIVKIKQEFFEEPDLNKFDPNYDFRFSTGALMCWWWESYKEKTLNSKNILDINIATQYRAYLKKLSSIQNDGELVKKKKL